MGETVATVAGGSSSAFCILRWGQWTVFPFVKLLVSGRRYDNKALSPVLPLLNPTLWSKKENKPHKRVKNDCVSGCVRLLQTCELIWKLPREKLLFDNKLIQILNVIILLTSSNHLYLMTEYFKKIWNYILSTFNSFWDYYNFIKTKFYPTKPKL